MYYTLIYTVLIVYSMLLYVPQGIDSQSRHCIRVLRITYGQTIKSWCVLNVYSLTSRITAWSNNVNYMYSLYPSWRDVRNESIDSLEMVGGNVHGHVHGHVGWAGRSVGPGESGRLRADGWHIHIHTSDERIRPTCVFRSSLFGPFPLSF